MAMGTAVSIRANNMVENFVARLGARGGGGGGAVWWTGRVRVPFKGLGFRATVGVRVPFKGLGLRV